MQRRLLIGSIAVVILVAIVGVVMITTSTKKAHADSKLGSGCVGSSTAFTVTNTASDGSTIYSSISLETNSSGGFCGYLAGFGQVVKSGGYTVMCR